MRPLEIALTLFALAAVCDLLRAHAGRERPVLAGLALLAMIAHVALEQARWQLYPVYAIIVFVLYLSTRVDAKQHGLATRIFVGLGTVTILFSGFLAYALPVPRIPAPEGPYKIGTATWQYDDTTRTDPYAPAPDWPRKIMLQAWYPAEAAPGARPAPWCGQIAVFGPAIAREVGLPPFFLNHLTLVQSHSIANAEVRAQEGGWPVVIYSHGWTGFRNVAVDEVEALASRGYVVLAPDHIHGAIATVLTDGTVALNNPAAMPPAEPKDARQIGIERLVDTYAGDLRFVLGLIEQMNSGAIPSPFQGKLDLGRIGLFGHSTGGGAVYEVAATDPRVKALFAYDLWTEPISPEVRTKPLTIPFYSLRSAEWALRDDAKARIHRELLAQAQGPKYDGYIADAKHADFTLMPILSPFAGLLGRTGPIDARRVLHINNACLTTFFDHHLRDQPAPPLQPPANDYPELKPAP